MSNVDVLGLMNKFEPVKCGYISRKYLKTKSWKRRWMVARDHHLLLYEDSQEYELLNLIDLKTVKVISTIASKKNDFLFGVLTDKEKLFYFKANTKAEMNSWIHVLNKLKTNEHKPRACSLQDSKLSNRLSIPSLCCSISTANSLESVLNRFSTVVDLNAERPAILDSQTANGDQLRSSNSIQGYLHKKCHRYNRWRYRWFVYRNKQLYYYKDHSEYKVLGIISASSILKVVEILNNKTNPSSSKSQKTYTFNLLTLNRKYKFSLPDKEEYYRWVNFFTKTINNK